MSIFGEHVYALVTGSSRGFGRAVADKFLAAALRHSPASITLTLHSRPASDARLADFRQQLLHSHTNAQTVVKVNTFLRDLDGISVEQAATAIPPNVKPNRVFLFNNAGILHSTPFRGMPANEFRKILSVNVTAMAFLASAFVQHFPPPTQLHVIHTSSLTALQPFVSWAGYCASKAASDMVHSVLAEEHPHVRVLNYAPGPMWTDMIKVMVPDRPSGGVVAADELRKTEDKQELIDPRKSAEKLVTLLFADSYKSGEHTDYYDDYYDD